MITIFVRTSLTYFKTKHGDNVISSHYSNSTRKFTLITMCGISNKFVKTNTLCQQSQHVLTCTRTQRSFVLSLANKICIRLPCSHATHVPMNFLNWEKPRSIGGKCTYEGISMTTGLGVDRNTPTRCVFIETIEDWVPLFLWNNYE